MCWLWADFSGVSEGDWHKDPLREQFAAAVCATRKFETWDVPAAEIKAEMDFRNASNYAEAASSVYWAYARKKKPSATRWGDKNNFYTAHVGQLLDFFPQAQIVHIVRDPRDVACSYRELSDSPSRSPYRPNLPTDCTAIAIEWVRNVTDVQRATACLSPDQYRLVKYEDIVTTPREEVSSLCTWMGLPFEHEMLLFHQHNQQHALEPTATMDWKALTLEPITERRVGRYHDRLTADEQQTISRLAAETMKSLGYGG